MIRPMSHDPQHDGDDYDPAEEEARDQRHRQEEQDEEYAQFCTRYPHPRDRQAAIARRNLAIEMGVD